MSKSRRKRVVQLPVNPEVPEQYHVPVLWKECIDALVHTPDGCYADGTLGGGGHTAGILERLSSDGRLYSFDADSNAIAECEQRFAQELSAGRKSRLILVHDNFESMVTLKVGLSTTMPYLDGVLLDLGVSSRQLDSTQIGLSYRHDAPLDMRFGAGRPFTAAELINGSSPEGLEKILRDYGEEPMARRIAKVLAERASMGGLWTTLDLRTAVEDCVPQHVLPRTLSRVFQAFRIVVNDELGVLERTLRGVTRRLKPGGRIVVLSYHSLEDRIVKDVFRDLAKTSVPDPGNLRSSTKPVDPLLTVVTKKPQEPSAEEIQRNVRARSARLRIAFRTETPYRDTELLFPGETDLQRLSDVRP